MNPTLIAFFNFILYFSLFIILRKREKSRIASFIVLIWTISAVASFSLIALFPVASRVYDELSITAMLFLFGCFLINIHPVSRIICPVRILGNPYILFIFSIFICVLNILPLSGNIVYFISHLGDSSSFGDNYGEDVIVLPGMIGVIDRYAKYLRIFTPILLVYFMHSFRKYPYLCISLALCCLNPIIGNLNIGSRFVFVTDTLYYVICFILLHRLLNKKMIRLTIIGFSIVATIFIFVFLSITLVKLESGNTSLMGSLSLYGGESFLNFSGLMWNQCEFTNGDNSFFIIKNLMGTYAGQLRDSDALTAESGMLANIFYTYVGDFYMDFGPFGTVAIVLFISLLLMFFVSRSNRRPYIYYYFFIAILLKIILAGFTYYPYLNLAKEIIYAPAVCILLASLDLYLKYSQNRKVVSTKE